MDARPEQTLADQRHDGRLRHVHLAQGGRRGRGERHVHVQLVDIHRRRGGQLLVECLPVPVVGAAMVHLVQFRENDCGGRPEQHRVHSLQCRAEPVQTKSVRRGPRHRVGEHAQRVAARPQWPVKRCRGRHRATITPDDDMTRA